MLPRDFAQRVTIVAAVSAERIEPPDKDQFMRQACRGDKFSERLGERVRVLVEVDRREKKDVGLAQIVAIEARAFGVIERALVIAARVHAVVDDRGLAADVHLRADLVETQLRIHDHAVCSLQRRDREPAAVERAKEPDFQSAPQMLRRIDREHEPRAARHPHRRDAAAAAGEKNINAVLFQQPRNEDLLAENPQCAPLIARTRFDEPHIRRSRLEEVAVRPADEDEIFIPRIPRGERCNGLLEKIERPGGLLGIFGKCGECNAHAECGGWSD